MRAPAGAVTQGRDRQRQDRGGYGLRSLFVSLGGTNDERSGWGGLGRDSVRCLCRWAVQMTNGAVGAAWAMRIRISRLAQRHLFFTRLLAMPIVLPMASPTFQLPPSSLIGIE